MKLSKIRKSLLGTAAGILAVSLAGANAAVDTGYNPNDLLLFFQNPTGSTGTDQVVVFSLGSTYDVFRRAATPGDATFGTTISLGNINTILGTYGTDWTSLAASSSIFMGAAGQNGSTNQASTATSNGDYARTVYVTKPRNGAGTVGQANSSGVTLPGTTANQGTLASNIANSNSDAVSQPGAYNVADVEWDQYNPFFNGNPSTAYGQLSGGVMGNLSSTTYTYGDVSNVVLGLDLYRATPTLNASGWQDINNIDGVTARQGYYLGTITLSGNGDVNFTAVPEPSTYALMTLGGALLLYGYRRRKLNA